MNQRINITYSIKLEELETEIRRLLTIALDKMEDTYADHSYLSESSGLLDLEAFRYIDGMRKELADIDAGLADVNNLIASYLDYEVQRLSPNQQPDIPAAASTEDPLANLNDKLAHFKEQWAQSQTTPPAAADEIPD